MAQYRFAVEQALAKANFLNTSDILVLQAMTLFLFVVRPHDDGRYCWSLVGLLVRLAQGMGLHRDGSNFDLPPLEVEIRRRVWWGIVTLDLRSAQQLGSDLAIRDRSFDTKRPSNINDADITPTDTKAPAPREGRSDVTMTLLRYDLFAMRRTLVTATMLDAISKSHDLRTSFVERERMFVDACQRLETKYLRPLRNYCQDKGTEDSYIAISMIARIIMAKNFLIIYQPMLDADSGVELTDDIRKMIYDISFEVVDYQHQINHNPRYEHFRWISLTYTNWDSIAYILLESTRRPWSAIVERGWEVVNEYSHNPADIAKTTDSIAATLPLRKLFQRAQKYRAIEIARLRANPDEAKKLDHREPRNPTTTQKSFDELPGDEKRSEEARERWRALVRPDATSPISGISAKSESASPKDPRASASPHANYPARMPNIAMSQAQTMSPSPGAYAQGIDVPDSAMDYMNDLMRPGSSFTMPDLWGIPSEAGGLNAPAMGYPSHLPQDEVLRQQAMMQAQLSKEQNQPYGWQDPYAPVMEDNPNMMSESLNWQGWQHDARGARMDPGPSGRRPWGPGPGL